MKVLRKFSYYSRFTADMSQRFPLWPVRIDITCPAIYGTSLTGAMRENFFSDSKKNMVAL
jgi:hypothetical protein